MGIGLEIGSAIGGAVGELFKTGYNIWSNQRDFDYQKALQNEVFAREDNAVQRRVKDLEAAGLNPNLAAGSAAGAGSVVGRSNTSQLSGNPVGTALDMASHVQQLRQQRTENKILKNQEDKSRAEASMAERENAINEIEFLNMMGINPTLKYDPVKKHYSVLGDIKLGLNDFAINTPMGKGNSYYTKELDNANSRLMQYLSWQYQNNQNSAAMLQKDNNFYIADKVGQYLGQGVQLFTGVGSGFMSFGRWNKYYR